MYDKNLPVYSYKRYGIILAGGVGTRLNPGTRWIYGGSRLTVRQK